jgi:predicted alpha/beta superfamily hydrolase
MILVGIDNAATIDGAKDPARDRTIEYMPYPDAYERDIPSPRGRDYPKFLFDEVMPLVEKAFRVDPGNVGLGGSSYGAIAALYACIAAPRPISRLMLESPPLFMFGERLTAEAARAALPPLVYVGIGTRETDDPGILTKGSGAIDRFMTAMMTKAGVRAVLNRVEGASHNSAAWKARFPTAMRALYGT